MTQIYYTERFLRSAKKLPARQQEKLADVMARLKENPFHSKLHSKPLSGKLSGLYSFRITRDWRVIFQLDVGHRKEIYR